MNQVKSFGYGYVVYWRDKKDGVEPLGLIAIFRTREAAEDFIYRNGIFRAKDWNKIGIACTPIREAW